MAQLSAAEAADILGVSDRQLYRYTEDGLIQQAPGRTFDPNEVYALKQIKSEKMTLEKLAIIAQRAYLQSKQQERLISWLMAAIGCDGALLSLEKEDLQSLQDKVERELDRDTFIYSAEEVFEWSRTFQLMGEEYFEALSIFLGSERPWQAYSKLAATMLKHRPEKEDPELMSAYRTLSLARTTMRQAAYFFAYINYGKHVAYSLFPESKGDFHQKVMAAVRMHDRERPTAIPGTHFRRSQDR